MDKRKATISKKMKGLSSLEASNLLQTFGPNELTRKGKATALGILLSQFTSPLILILIAAAITSVAMGYLPGQEAHYTDAALIMVIVMFSGLFGFFQDYRAEKTIEALQQMATPQALVIRDGKELDIPSTEVVPGDLLLVEAGNVISADGKIVENFHLEVDESILTGESVAIQKMQDEEVFKNTHVTTGHAHVRVSNTGMNTRIGQIAEKLQDIGEGKTTFQKELSSLGKKLSWMTLGIVVIVGAVGYLKYGLYEGIMTAISLAVAAVPEGLPAVVVLALALGARQMVRKNALIRRLAVTESIGAIDLICTDKTGTLTQNEMTVTQVFLEGEVYVLNRLPKPVPEWPALQQLLTCGILCNNVKTHKTPEKEIAYVGEQTEIALFKLSEKHLPSPHIWEYLRIDEVAFNSERKMMSVLVQNRKGNQLVYSKGAPEVLIQKCNRILSNGKISTLTKGAKEKILTQNIAFASDALRVLGFAYKEDFSGQIEKDLIWIGLQAMIDPPREEARQAIEDCKTAGIRVIMITGDNPVTAKAIANRVHLESNGETIDGNQLDELTDEELVEMLDRGVNIFARTNPFHKLRILGLLQGSHNVAMTGDGVNDALALKKADAGIAMGKKGSEVARQVSDVILLDDNFSTIRHAIEQGRTIFQNIRKFINYLLTCNIAEVLVIFIATLLFELEGPVLLAVQILWINLLTDGLVALALGADPPAHDTMSQPPRKAGEPLLNRELIWLILSIGMTMMVLLLLIFWWVLPQGLDMARTVLLTGFVLFEFVRIGAIRSEENLGWLDNKWLIAALVASLALHLVIIYSPLNTFFSLVPLGWNEWGILIAGAVVAFVLAIGITRLVGRNKNAGYKS